MPRFNMTFDNPAQNAIRQNILYQYQQQQQKQRAGVPSGKIDLARPMIGRVYSAKPGCSACGKG